MTTARSLYALPDRPKIVVPYERVSALMGRDDESFRSPDLQRAASLQRIAAYPNAVVFQDALDNPHLYRDIDKTGRDFNREGIQRILRLKREGKIDGIAVLDLSRIGRDAPETLRVVEELRADGGVVLSSKETFDDTDEGMLMLTLFAAFAQLYSDRIATGWQAVISARAEDGHHNGTPPIGYRRVRGETGRTTIELDDAKAVAMLEAFERFDRGEPATSIERDLKSRGVIGRATVGILRERALQNPFYVGDVRLFIYTGKAKKRKRTDVPPLVFPGRHTAIVPRDLFDRVQARLASSRRIAPRHVNPVHALSGLAFCPSCGLAATVNLGKGKARDQRVAGAYLRCMNGMKSHDCPGFGAARCDEIELAVLAEITRYADAFSVGDVDVAIGIARRAAAVADRERIERAIAKLDAAQTDADFDLRLGDLTRERHERLTAKIDAELVPLRAALFDVADVEDAPSVDEFVIASTRLRQEWPTSTPGERNRLLRAAGVLRVEVAKATRWREPVDGRVAVTFSI